MIGAGKIALGAGGSVAGSSGLNLTAPGAIFDISSSGSSQSIQVLIGVAGSVVNRRQRTQRHDRQRQQYICRRHCGWRQRRRFRRQPGQAGHWHVAADRHRDLHRRHERWRRYAGARIRGIGRQLEQREFDRVGCATFDISGGGNQTVNGLTGVSDSHVGLGANALTVQLPTAATPSPASSRMAGLPAAPAAAWSRRAPERWC